MQADCRQLCMQYAVCSLLCVQGCFSGLQMQSCSQDINNSLWMHRVEEPQQAFI